MPVPRCFDFTQDRCTRGDDCRFQHIEDTGPTCYDFSVGKCTRDDCKFVHSEVHVPGRRRTERRDAPYNRNDRGRGGREDRGRAPHNGAGRTGTADRCHDFTVGKCNRGDDCRFMHPTTCYDYSIGECKRDNCRFFHAEVHTPGRRELAANRRRSRTPNRYGPPPRARAETPRGGRNVRNAPAAQPRGRQNNKPDRCFDFTQGRCTRGFDCRFYHEEVCYDFTVNRCDRDDCRFLHISRDQERDQGRDQGRASERGRAPTRDTRGAPRKCYDFTQDKCDRGDDCKFSHDLHLD